MIDGKTYDLHIVHVMNLDDEETLKRLFLEIRKFHDNRDLPVASVPMRPTTRRKNKSFDELWVDMDYGDCEIDVTFKAAGYNFKTDKYNAMHCHIGVLNFDSNVQYIRSYLEEFARGPLKQRGSAGAVSWSLGSTATNYINIYRHSVSDETWKLFKEYLS